MSQEPEVTYGTVKLPGNYFSKDKRNYNDFRMAWAREGMQNSLDAGATRIDFTLASEPDSDFLTLVCQDNGSGMDKDTLLNVFLELGGSKKPEGGIGGFGHAKIVLAFAHKEWRLSTHDMEVTGVGGEYSLKSLDSWHQGVRLEVKMGLEDNSVWSMRKAIEQIVTNSNLPKGVVVTLNDEELKCPRSKPRYNLNTVLGDLNFDDKPHGYDSSNLWVRMNGLAMFKCSLWTSGTTAFEGFLDLTGNSVDVLTQNRDGLCSDQNEILNKLMQELVNDREKLKLGGDIDLTLNRREVKFEHLSAEDRAELYGLAEAEKITPTEMMDKLNSLINEMVDPSAMNPFRHLAEKVKSIQSELDDRIGKIPANWYPENFKVKFSDSDTSPENAHKHGGLIASSMSLKRTAKMAAGWSRMINELLDTPEYRDVLGVEKDTQGRFFYRDRLIQTGFVFGSVEGLNVVEKDQNRISILLNAQKANSEKWIYGDLIDIAHHELTHIRVKDHSESFTQVMSQLQRVSRRHIPEKTLIKAFKEAVAELELPEKPEPAPEPKRVAPKDAYTHEFNF
ncbi:ATP-binding protein (plasmid) [Pseudomonas silesiensis]|uniref:ATP-binding protein n=1 Tax=Pseudomonas silesiensis TaxID=1853130 RepID=UPI0030D3E764